MIELMSGLPDNVLAFEASGKVSGKDYEDELIPAMEDKLEKYGTINALYYFGPRFDEFEGEAMWDDAEVGMHHMGDFEKMAVVADKKWIRRTVRAIAWMMPGKVKVYDGSGLVDAKAWVSS